MPRKISLRQIEAFKAVIENGTITRASELLHMSQPAMSKLISNLESDTGLQLFDRVKGRLAPTEHALRLHDEVDRIFAGVRQVENAVEAIRRDEQGRLSVGVMPALSSAFIQCATTSFLNRHKNVFCSIEMRSSPRILDRLIARKLDIGLIGGGFDNPYATITPLLEHPLVCIMSPSHSLANKSVIEPQDLNSAAFVSFSPDSYTDHCVEETLEPYGVKRKITLIANMAPTLCAFVAAGCGVSLVHPLLLSSSSEDLAVRRFTPEIPQKIQICRGEDNRNGELIEAFADESRAKATEMCKAILRGS